MKPFDPFFTRRIHHLTKYPSIENYHNPTTGDRSVVFDAAESVFVYEKIDGTNVRIVMQFDGDGELSDFFIGSRSNILYARGDRNFSDDLGIVQDIQSKFPLKLTDAIKSMIDPSKLLIVYGELFGGKIGKAAKQYSSDESITGFRAFDVATITLPDMDAPFDSQFLGDYRDQNLQFVSQEVLFHQIQKWVHIAPLIGETRGDLMPLCFLETKAWLEEIAPKSRCDLGGGMGRTEGVVVRNEDRSKIVKIRFENYRYRKGRQ